jgi:hypothetical protein
VWPPLINERQGKRSINEWFFLPQFRVPPPGAVVKGGQLTMNAEFPGLTIEYSTDGKTFTTYTAPVNVGLGAKLAFRSSFNGRQSRVETMDCMPRALIDAQ